MIMQNNTYSKYTYLLCAGLSLLSVFYFPPSLPSRVLASHRFYSLTSADSNYRLSVAMTGTEYPAW